MDLKERVKDSINSLDLPLKCLPGYLDGKHDPELIMPAIRLNNTSWK